MNWVNHPVKAAEFLHTRKSAVLIPIVETEEGESLLYEVRSPKLKWQPGDISFPGGGEEFYFYPGPPGLCGLAYRGHGPSFRGETF